jgi:hypothetical protein
MSAFCSCFRSSPHVTDNNSSRAGRRNGNRQSIVKDKGMSLLEMNKRGMDEGDEEELFDDDGERDEGIRVSHQTDMLNHRYEENKVRKSQLSDLAIVLSAWRVLANLY